MPISPVNVTIHIDDVEFDGTALLEAIHKSFTRDPFEHYVNGICGLVICLLGIVSNALSFSTLIRRTMRLSTYVYLAGLCLSDFTTCLCLIPGYILDAYPIKVSDYELPRTYAYTQLLIIAGAISTTTRVLSVWLCVAFTIDRWIMICRPFVGPLYCTMKNARCVTLIIYILGVFYAIPLLLEYEPHEETALTAILFPNHNKKFYRHKLTKLGRNSIFRWTYVLINALGVYVIPLTIIIILNRKLLLSIRLLERRSAEYNAPLPTKQGVTIMLLATTILLLVFRSPSATISVMWLISAKMFINEKAPFRLRKFHSIANLCATLNAATTFIMFIIYGTKFRSEFTRVYCCCVEKFQKRKNTIQIKQDQQQDPEQQQIQQLLLNGNNKNDQDPMNQMNTSSTNQSKCQKLARHSSSATTSTTTTSIVSLSSLRRLRSQRRKPRYSLEQEYDAMNNINNNTNFQQHELTIREDDCNNENIDRKSVSLKISYCDWFKSLVRC